MKRRHQTRLLEKGQGGSGNIQREPAREGYIEVSGYRPFLSPPSKSHDRSM